jgi:hypothetical protein
MKKIGALLIVITVHSWAGACPPPSAIIAPTDLHTTFIRTGVGEFGAPRSNGASHAGVDLVVNADYAEDAAYAVYAVAAGTVAYAQMNGSEDSGYGNLVVIDHGDGCYTMYAHLASKPFTPVRPGGNLEVKVGDAVHAGQRLGYFVSVTFDIDSTGNARKVEWPARRQTHFECIVAPSGRRGPGSLAQTILRPPAFRTDPTNFLKGLGYRYLP